MWYQGRPSGPSRSSTRNRGRRRDRAKADDDQQTGKRGHRDLIQRIAKATMMTAMTRPAITSEHRVRRPRPCSGRGRHGTADRHALEHARRDVRDALAGEVT